MEADHLEWNDMHTLSQPVMRTLQIQSVDVKITITRGRVDNATLAEPDLERWHSRV